jgi:hypothetical protein
VEIRIARKKIGNRSGEVKSLGDPILEILKGAITGILVLEW